MRFVLVCIVLLVLMVLAGCGGDSPTLTQPPPPPTISSSDTATAEPTTTTAAPTTTAIEDEMPDNATTMGQGIAVISNTATITFPDYITFSIELTSPAIVDEMIITYASDERTLVPSTHQAQPDFDEDLAINVEWKWEMKKTGSIPPGATIWWEWVITNQDDETLTTPRQEITYSDTRFQWDFREYDIVDVYWHSQSEALIEELLAEVEYKLSLIELNVNIPAERKPKVFIYRSSDELKDAVLFEQQWTGALAFTSYNIILTAVNSGSLEWAKDALPHEITHLLVEEAVFGPFGDLPVWLNEGLAQYTESEMDTYTQGILNTAITDDALISIQSLSGSFPADPSGAYLAYAESRSVVEFMVDSFGWEKMRQLLDAFKDGSTNDKALLTVYGFDVNGLESQWKVYIGAN